MALIAERAATSPRFREEARRSTTKTKNGRTNFLPSRIRASLFTAVDRFLEFSSGSELGYTAGGNFDRGTRLRVASIAGLPLRNREGPKTPASALWNPSRSRDR